MSTNVEGQSVSPNDAKPVVSRRFFVDERIGCIAIRDTEHPRYDADYPGLHHDTCDVVWFRLGYKDDSGWHIHESDRKTAEAELERLQNGG